MYAVPDAEQKKNFAREQLTFLRQHGVADRVQLSRIFKAAGPGQIQDGWRIAHSENWNSNIGELRKEIFISILVRVANGQLPTFEDEDGVEFVTELLQLQGFAIPKANNHAAFYKTLYGVLEMLSPGAYPFSEEDLIDIEVRSAPRDDTVSDLPPRD